MDTPSVKVSQKVFLEELQAMRPRTDEGAFWVIVETHFANWCAQVSSIQVDGQQIIFRQESSKSEGLNYGDIVVSIPPIPELAEYERLDLNGQLQLSMYCRIRLWNGNPYRARLSVSTAPAAGDFLSSGSRVQ
jgi:hypothetical protein